MTEALNEIFDFLSSKIGELADLIISSSVLKFLADLLSGIASITLNTGADLYNRLIKLAASFLMDNPQNWMGGTGWNTIKSLNNGFVTIGLSLITVFWLIGFYQETVDFRSEIRLEKFLIYFVKLSVAQWFVCNSLNLVGGLFSLVGDLLPNSVQTPEIDISYVRDSIAAFSQKKDITVLSFATMCVCTIVILIFAVVMIVVGLLILKEAFVRFFKVLIIVPYGALASATIAGTHTMAHSAASFYKYALNCILEAVTMIITLAVYSGIVNGMNNYMSTGANALGTEVDAASATTTAEQLSMSIAGNLLIHIVLTLVLYSLIKKASEITQRALGL